MKHYSLDQLAYRFGKPAETAVIRQQPEHFKVQELIRVEPDGTGEHLWLNIRKRGMNTNYLAKQVAKWAGVPERNVSHAGLKDRHAVTEQWLSVQLPGKPDPDFAQLESDDIQIIAGHRHSQKLRPAVLLANRFELLLTEVSDPQAVIERWQQITAGVPNYFGEQRFGHDFGNIDKAKQVFAGKRFKRHLQGLFLSSARSWLFNRIVSKRVAEQQLETLIGGDMLMLAGSRSHFMYQGEADLPERLASGDVQLTAPLWGEGFDNLQDDYRQLVQSVIDDEPELAQGLVAQRLKLALRPLLLKPEHGRIEHVEEGVKISFVLPSGSFATSILRELVSYQDVSGSAHADLGE
ncbi:tRNA pseudouridine(13) synthase TruD [Neiella sp. HB171785]|uniref:tRNA pseudouridine synthase D n=1 Tax=Neiella litorisoli TaxID=2771431 RepID=A0A8J6QI22_9GAMM|nr:tRNA pseudouridine(13) synthase TruD [Neiella litorisoli]MBD1388902.1 tRNA pseudouridine(13) synthase TruD [Neiella litorisoli]